MLPLLVLWLLVYIPEYYGYGDDYHRNWRLLPDNCGVGRDASRIVGGEVANLGQFPWMAKLGYFSVHTIAFQCAGSLINEYFVLSAGHCVDGMIGKLLALVRLGEFDANSRIDCDSYVCAPPVQDIPVEYYINNPEYIDDPKIFNDICLIKLARKAEFNEFVQPICLPRGSLLDKNFKITGSLDVAGWGVVDSNTLQTSDRLLHVRLTVTPKKLCDLLYGLQIESQICIGQGGGKDSCDGDSGGPAMKQYMTDGQRRYFIIGVLSFGMDFCGEGPGVYTKVAFYITWILDHLEG